MHEAMLDNPEGVYSPGDYLTLLPSRRGIVYLYQVFFTGFEQVNLVACYDTRVTHHGREFRTTEKEV